MSAPPFLKRRCGTFAVPHSSKEERTETRPLGAGEVGAIPAYFTVNCEWPTLRHCQGADRIIPLNVTPLARTPVVEGKVLTSDGKKAFQ